MNEDDDPIVWTAACYDQLDTQDPSVILKSAFCGLRYGVSRSKAEWWIGRRRERVGYVEMLAKVCQEGLRDMGYSRGLDGGVCWIGGQDEWSEGEASEREWYRRGFEECHGRFGVDARLEWRGEQPLIKYRMPAIEGSKFNGEYMEMALDPSQFTI